MTYRKIIFSLILLFIVIFTIKLCDILIGVVMKDDLWINTIPGSGRSLIIKEYGKDIDVSVFPDKITINSSDGLQKKIRKLRTDSNGYIIGPLDSQKQNQSVDIIFYGGSTTECLYVDEDHRFPYVVGNLLKKSNGSTVRTLNAGTAGSNSMHSLLLYLAKGAENRPRYVVLMENANDLNLLLKTGSYWSGPIGRSLYGGVNDQKSTIEFFRAIKDFLAPNFWKLYKVVSLKFGFIKNEYIDEWADHRKRLPEQDSNHLEGEFRSSLITFVKTTRAWGSEPVLMTQFSRLNISDNFAKNQYEKSYQPISFGDYVKLYKRFNEVIREVAKSEGVYLIDLENKIPQENAYIYDVIHLNDEGSLLVADIIAKEFAKPRFKF